MSLEANRSARVRINDLHIRFGDTDVLKGVNLDIQDGEFFAFLGPSGSGKSTLLRAVAGFGPKPRGSIVIGDDNVVSQPPWRRNVGMVFQSYALWPHMSVWRNVAFGLEERKVRGQELRRRVGEALELVGLSNLAKRYPSQLSGGQQQRVALARTVVVRPRVLLLDEPLSNLDANLRVQMRHEILMLQRQLGLTTIFVTHDQEEANTTSDRIAVLNEGVVQQVGSPVELYDHPVNRFVASFLGTANILDGHVKPTEDGHVFVSEQGLEIPVDGNYESAVSIMFRPQNVQIFEPEAKLREGCLALSGVVRSREFMGSSLRYRVEASGHTFVVEQVHLAGVDYLQIGSHIKLVLDPKQSSSMAANTGVQI